MVSALFVSHSEKFTVWTLARILSEKVTERRYIYFLNFILIFIVFIYEILRIFKGLSNRAQWGVHLFQFFPNLEILSSRQCQRPIRSQRQQDPRRLLHTSGQNLKLISPDFFILYFCNSKSDWWTRNHPIYFYYLLLLIDKEINQELLINYVAYRLINLCRH